MRALLPCAGLGTRMGDLPQPKQLLPIMGEPILAHTIKFLESWGVTQFVVVVSDETQEPITKFLLDTPINSIIVKQPEPEGECHAIYCAKPYLLEPFAVCWTDFLIAAHAPRDFARNYIFYDKLDTINHRFGPLQICGDRVVVGFDRPSMYCEKGLYFIHDYVKFWEYADYPESTRIRDVFDQMLNGGSSIYSSPIEHCYDCGTEEEYLATKTLLER